MKITYRTADGYRSTAYLDCDHPGCERDTHTGENKYTGDPITVRWNDDTDEWQETP